MGIELSVAPFSFSLVYSVTFNLKRHGTISVNHSDNMHFTCTTTSGGHICDWHLCEKWHGYFPKINLNYKHIGHLLQ